jgi:hypothetical protein
MSMNEILDRTGAWLFRHHSIELLLVTAVPMFLLLPKGSHNSLCLCDENRLSWSLGHPCLLMGGVVQVGASRKRGLEAIVA